MDRHGVELALSQVIDGVVVRDLEDPAAELVTRIVRPDRPECPDKGLLSKILGQRPITNHTEYERKDRALVPSEKLPERRLPALVQEKRFRLDLYQRLDVITLEIPPLRERPGDSPSLVQFFVEKYSKYYQGEVVGVDPQVYDALAQCAMEGNVRELENIVRRALAFKEGGNVLELIDLPPSLFSDRGRSTASAELPREVLDAARRMIERGTLSLEDFVGQCEQSLLAELVNRKQSSYADLARRLSISRRTLYNKLQRYGL